MAIAAAQREHAAGDVALCLNRVYYACFDAASAALLQDEHQFVKHAGVRAALHQHLVNTGRLAVELGRFYDKAFEDRQEADYAMPFRYEPQAAAGRIVGAEQFVAAVKQLLLEPGRP